MKSVSLPEVSIKGTSSLERCSTPVVAAPSAFNYAVNRLNSQRTLRFWPAATGLNSNVEGRFDLGPELQHIRQYNDDQ